MNMVKLEKTAADPERFAEVNAFSLFSQIHCAAVNWSSRNFLRAVAV